MWPLTISPRLLPLVCPFIRLRAEFYQHKKVPLPDNHNMPRTNPEVSRIFLMIVTMGIHPLQSRRTTSVDRIRANGPIPIRRQEHRIRIKWRFINLAIFMLHSHTESCQADPTTMSITLDMVLVLGQVAHWRNNHYHFISIPKT
jgi:hypothetical protein